ncbi:hypothetical protein Tco_1396151 [Tanacetum coccineum]
MNYNNLVGRSIHLGDVVDWEFLSNKGLAQSFFDSINTDTFSGPQWVNLFQINEPVFRELVREFFASFEFNDTPCRYEPLHKGVTFRLGGVEREMSLLEFGWIVGLYSKREFKDVATLSGLRRAKMVNSTHLTHLEGAVCNTPYWLAKYLKGVRDKSVIFGGMFVTKIAQSFGLLTKEMPVTKGFVEEDEGDDEEGDGEGGNEGAGGSTDIYRNMSAGDWCNTPIFDI